jgi:hypothetical protein
MYVSLPDSLDENEPANKPGEACSGDAWALEWYCDGAILPTTSPIYIALEDAGGCPNKYSASEDYKVGEKVLSRYCNKFEPRHWADLGNLDRETLLRSIIGYCNG